MVRPTSVRAAARHALTPAALADAALEISVVGSFSRIGPRVRGRLAGWTSPVPGCLDGRTVLITGPTSGIGRETAEALAALGARIVLVGRDPARLETVRADLARRYGVGRAATVVADLGSLASIRAAADAILADEDRLDVLIDNAGAIFPERRPGPDGIDETFALLVVGPFALEARLQPLLRRTRGSRVIAVTSGGMYTERLDLDDPQGRDVPHSGPRAYARAKRAQVALSREWARRLAPLGIAHAVMHPGWTATPGLAASLPRFSQLMGPLLRSPADGADTIVWLATEPDPLARSGQLFLDRHARPFDRLPGTRLSPADRARLWDLVVGLSGEPDPAPG
jgi:NAD(P)-dependent dehydrogenase (short-subunit alcohol dehydrogenase family)